MKVESGGGRVGTAAKRIAVLGFLVLTGAGSGAVDGRAQESPRQVRRHLVRATPGPSGPVGPYLGQTPPGRAPEEFGPGVVSLPDTYAGGITFSPDGNEIYFSRFTLDDLTDTMWVMRQTDGAWSPPEPFTPCPGGTSPSLTPDGARLYFVAPVGVMDSEIWYIDRVGDGWSVAAKLAGTFSTRPKMSPSAAASGTLYFTQIEPSHQGRWYRAAWADNAFGAPAALSSTVNRFITNDFIFVVPDESVLLLGAVPAPDTQRLFASFKGSNGVWRSPVDLGDGVNSTDNLISPSLSPDGKYLFFVRQTSSSSAIFWVDANVVFDLKPAG